MSDVLPTQGAGVPVQNSSGLLSSTPKPVEPLSPPIASPPAPIPSPPQPVGPPPIEVILDRASQLFVLSETYLASVNAIKKEFSLTEDQSAFVSDLDRLVMGGQLTIEQYLLALEDEFTTLPEADRDRLYAKLLAERFVPFGDRFSPSAVEVARSEGLKLPTAGHYRIYDKPLSYSATATEVATAAGFSIMGGPVRERLRDLVMSKLKGVRTDAQVLEVMTRSLDVGGVGLDAATADRALAAMSDVLGRAKVLSEDEFANWLADQSRAKAESRSGATSSPVISSDISSNSSSSSTESDDPEIAAIQAKMAAQASVPSSELDKAVAATVSRVTYHAPDEYLAKRLRNVISSRLRDVRSQLELKQLLMRDTKVGGLGLKADEADGLAKQIEDAYTEFHNVISQEEKGKIEGQLEEQKQKIEIRRKQEAEEHAKWFEEKIRARKTGEAQKTQVLENMKRIMGGQTTPLEMPVHPVDAKEQRMETEKFGPLVPAGQASVNSKQGVASSKPVAGSSKQSVAEPNRNTPAVLKVSPATMKLAEAAAASSGKPTLDGMSYAGPQLVGPIGELKKLTVAEFRRLSKNPQDAVEKIRQKIEILGQESFEKRIEGVRAFQESPLQGAYMGLVSESFKTLRPVAALADEKRKAGSDTLSSDEIGAIVALNGTLHF
ncbi:MAG: hypothetical protein ABIO72_00210 [Patescibacteria group bacterium]